MDPEALDQRLHVALTFLPGLLRRDLLRVLVLPDEDRVREIGRLHQEGTQPGLVELLIDVEEAPGIRRRLAAELRAMILRGS